MEKTILITGASSGFGLLTIEHLIAKRHRIIATLRGGDQRFRNLDLSNELKAALDRGQVIALEMHMEKPDSFESARQLIDQKFGGKLDVLINNAGFGLMGPTELFSTEEIRYQMEVNFFGIVGLTKSLLPAIKAAHGRIMNISSLVGRVTFPFFGVYSASKWALEAYSEALAHELSGFGVQVCLIEPGAFRTKFNDNVNFGEEARTSPGGYREQLRVLERGMKGKGAQYLPKPDGVAKLIARYCDRRSIPMRRPVGVDARFVLFLNAILPNSWKVSLTRLITKLALPRIERTE